MGTASFRDSIDYTWTESTLGVAFLLIAAAVAFARGAPATGYERSIYASTPTVTWLLLSVALAVAVGVAIFRNSHRMVAIALAVGGTAMTVVSALPIIRGYHFLGSADPLTHLGWTKDISAGVMEPGSLFYPAYHSISLALSRLLGLSFEHALLLGMVMLFVPFLVFVPLTVRAITGDARATAIAGVASWMVLPVNNVATHMVPHTNTLALFYVPVLLFAMVAYLQQSPSTGTSRLGVTPIGVLLAVLSAGFVLLHPQHAVNVLLLFGAVCGVQFVVRRYHTDHQIASHRPLYAPTVLLAGMLAVWFSSHGTATRAAQSTLESLFRGDIGAASEVAQRGGSLLAIGGGILDLFVRLFLVSTVFAIATAAFLLLPRVGLVDLDWEWRRYTTYVTVALVPLTLLFVVYFLGTPKMAFRQLGFIFVLVTVMGGIALARFTGRLENAGRTGRSALVVLLVACLLLSLATVFASPFIYKASPGVSEQSMDGYETTFDHRAAEVPIATLNDDPTRFSDGIYGTAGTSHSGIVGAGEGSVATDAFNAGDLPGAYPADSYYLALTASDVQTQLEVYRQLNYERAGLEALRSSTNADRVVSNGEFRLFLVSGESDS